MEKIGAPSSKRRHDASSWLWRSEEEFQRQLADARVTSLSCSKGSESARAELLEIRDARLRAGARGHFLIKEVHAVKDVKELRAELEFPAFREDEALGESHVPVILARHSKGVLARSAVRAD